MLTTKLPNASEERKPLDLNGRFFVELFSHGQVNAQGHALSAAKNYFKGRKDLKVLEIGVLRGHNAENIHKELKPELLVLVDPWEISQGSLEYHDNNWAELYYRVQRKPNIVVIKAFSEQARSLISIKFDFIYIDGDHGDIDKDLRLWRSAMNENGIVAGHDYNYPNIEKSVKEWFSNYTINTSPYHPHGGMDWWVFI